jgi:hypothetical protein
LVCDVALTRHLTGRSSGGSYRERSVPPSIKRNRGEAIVTVDVSSGFPNDAGGLQIVVRERGTTTMIEVQREWDLVSRATAGETLSRVLEREPRVRRA